jgi:hypothetical protein
VASKWLVYALVDPRNAELRYVGKSCQGMKRPRQHSAPKQLAKQTHTARWLRELGTRPLIRVLEELPGPEGLYEAERWWIDHCRIIGHKLTNHTDGGPGTQGLRHTPEALAKISERHKGIPKAPEAVARMRTAKTGVKLGAFSEEHRRRIAAAQGRPFIDDTGRRWVSQREAGRFYGIKAQNIYGVLKGLCKTAGGRSFTYETESGA